MDPNLPVVDRFDVYLRGSKEDTPDGRRGLAERIASSFGISAGPVVERLERGHVRVKKGAPEEVARTYVAKLEKLGGIAVMVAEGQVPPPLVRRTFTEEMAAPRLVALDGSAAEVQPLFGAQSPPSEFQADGAEVVMAPLELDDKAVAITFTPRPVGTPAADSPRAPAPPGSTRAAGPAARAVTPDLPFEVPSGVSRQPIPPSPDLAPEVLSPRLAHPRTPPIAGRPVVGRTADGEVALWSGSLRERPVTRLVLVFALGLVGGVVPAALYAYGVQHEEVKPLRQKQAALGAAPPASGDTTQADEIGVRVRAIKMRAGFVIVVLWVVVGGAVGYAVHRFT